MSLLVGVQVSEHFANERWISNFDAAWPDWRQSIGLAFLRCDQDMLREAGSLDVLCAFRIGQDLIDAADHVKWAYIMQSGLESMEGIHLPFGIYSASGIASQSVAEYVLAVTLHVTRGFNTMLENQRRRRWSQADLVTGTPGVLAEKTFGVLGLGHNGSAAARLLAALGCRVIGLDRNPCGVDGIERVCSGRDSLLTLIENSDVLAICLPGGSETRGLIGKRELSALGPSGLLINTGRGEIVRESDLVAALREGVIGGAALDVTSEEPLPSSSPLWRCPNIIITPHIAGNINNHVSEIQLDFIRRLRNHANRH